MKKNTKRKKIIQKAIVLPLIAVLLSTNTIMANTERQKNNQATSMDDWVMEIPDTQTDPGVEGLVIPVNGIWADDIIQYRCNVTYDPDMIELTEVNLDGCAGEGFDIYLEYGSDYFFIMVQGSPAVPAGTGSLVNMVVNITDESGETEISFQGEQDQNLYKAGDGYHYPTLYDGTITIGDALPELTIKSISGGFGITAIIENIGDANATDVNWNITLEGGLIVLGNMTTGKITNIQVGNETTIKSSLIFGIGKSIITVFAECAEGARDKGTANGFVIACFVLGVS